MGDVSSTRGDGAAAAAPGSGAPGAAPDAGACACATTTCWPLSLVECPARLTRTDDHAPNKPRRTSIAPSSGASLRICTSWAMMSRFMAPKLHELQEVRQPVAQELRPRRREMNVVFDPHAAVARQVHARLDRHDRARRQRIVVGPRKPGRFVHFEPEPVTERVAKRLAESAGRDRIARQRIRFAPAHAGAHAGARALLRLADQSVQHPLALARACPYHHGARDVRAVAIHLSPEV